jgi:hypothetical protein
LSSTARAQLFGPLREAQRERAAGVGVRADLARDEDVVPRPECLADHLVGEAVAVELGRVDVVDAEVEGTAEDGDGRAGVALQVFEPHGAVPDAGDGAAGQGRGHGGPAFVR